MADWPAGCHEVKRPGDAVSHCILTASGATCVQIWRALAEIGRDVSVSSGKCGSKIVRLLSVIRTF
jgi:hypothetical protein